MATHFKSTSLSPKGGYLAHSGIDGRLKIWNTETSVLVQEYTPSSHLSTTCSCLIWCPVVNNVKTPKKKKKKKLAFQTEGLIAIGTTTGNILLYSILKGELHSLLEEGHRDVVNDISWHTESNSLFSCSNDQYIVHWNLEDNKIKYKWKADGNSIYSVCVVDENTLLSASSSIKWWNLESRTVLKKFTGHATEVFCIVPMGLSEKTACYFLSAAVGDRLINAWQLKTEGDSSSLVGFTLCDEPISLDVYNSVSKEQNMLMTVVTSTGILQIFEHQLNGKCKTPSKPKYTVQIANEEGKNSSVKTQLLPILSAHICPENENEILIAYGTLLRPIFEKIQLTECKTQTILIRTISVQTPHTETGIDVYKQAKSSEVTYLVPGTMAPLLSEKKKRSLSLGKDDVTVKELSLGDRIDSISKPQPDESPPKLSANSMVEVLLQGLKSDDKKLLNKVFNCKQEIMIETVKLLPAAAIQPLLKQLQCRIHEPAYWNRVKYLKWLKTVMLYHTTNVSKCQEIEDMLMPISNFLASRGDTFTKLLQLKGRLELILSQVKLGKEQQSGISTEPLIYYEEESSSEEDDERKFDLVQSHSESEDNWDDEMDTDECSDDSKDESSESSNEEM